MDNINKPKHYELDGIPGVEVKDVIKSVLGNNITSFYIGNVIKYVLRYKKKNGVEDLKKARLYLDWAIKDYHLGLKVNPEVITKLLKNTTIYTADGRSDKLVYTDPDTNQTVNIDVDPEVEEKVSEFGEQLDWFDKIGYDVLSPRMKKSEIKHNNEIRIKVGSVSEEVFRKFETTNLGEKWAKKTKK